MQLIPTYMFASHIKIEVINNSFEVFFHYQFNNNMLPAKLVFNSQILWHNNSLSISCYYTLLNNSYSCYYTLLNAAAAALPGVYKSTLANNNTHNHSNHTWSFESLMAVAPATSRWRCHIAMPRTTYATVAIYALHHEHITFECA